MCDNGRVVGEAEECTGGLGTTVSTREVDAEGNGRPGFSNRKLSVAHGVEGQQAVVFDGRAGEIDRRICAATNATFD